MSIPVAPSRPLVCLKQALQQCRAKRPSGRFYATAVQSHEPPKYPSLQPRYPAPSRGFRPSQATKQNRVDESGMKKIRVLPSPRSTVKACPDPISVVYKDQLKVLDPTGARTRLFSKENPERVHPGDILLVRQKNGDPFAGVCLVVRQRNSPVDTSVLLRNQLTRVGVEMWFKVYSPNVEGIEIVQRKAKRARRAKLYYMRKPKHDMGNVDNIVRQYQRQRSGGPVASKDSKGRDANSNRRKVKRR